jgi:tetratricopeptide (TPR) repeat protein
MKLSLFFAVLVTIPLRSQPRLSPQLDEMFSSGIHLTFAQDYRGADSVAELLSKIFPDHPIGALLKLGILQAQRMDFELEINEPLWDSLIRSSTAASENLVKSGKNELWGKYFRGVALGSESYKRSEIGNWIGTIAKAMASTKEFEYVVQKDSTMYDAFLGIGTYKYWKSRKIEFLQWLPFIFDEREHGIAMLEQTATKSSYSKLPATVSLAWILFDAKRFSEAVEWSKRGLQKYPRNRQLLWICASSMIEDGRFSEAELICTRLIEEYERLTLSHRFFEIVWRNNLRVCLDHQHKYTEANAQTEKLASLKSITLPNQFAERAEEIFSTIDRARPSSHQ